MVKLDFCGPFGGIEGTPPANRDGVTASAET